MKVKEVMNKAKIINEDNSIREAAESMAKTNIGALLVIQGSKLKGIVTERDILKKVTAKNKIPNKVYVSEIMTNNLITSDPEASVEDVIYLMVKNKIKKVPILDEGKLVGIVTSTDLIKNCEDSGEAYLFD